MTEETPLELVLIKTLEAMAQMVELRDPYTAGHQYRVAMLAAAIAKKMHFDDDQVKGVYLGALVHDIGKIHVPSELLGSARKLTEAEFELVSKHCQQGCDVLKDIPFPWPIARIILEHHERLDGSGYPKGLSAKDICMEARIVAVADVYDAMVSQQAYHAAHTHIEAIKELKEGGGSKYDLDVVNACVELIEVDQFSFPAADYKTGMFDVYY